MPRTKNEVLTIRTTTEVKTLLRLAAERERRKLVESGDVDVMIAIRSNFFYTRTVPCELWHLDRGKGVPRPPRYLPSHQTTR